MSPRQALVSALHLFVVLSFFIAGLFFIAFPHLLALNTHLIGFVLFLTSLILLLGFYALDRGRYLVIQMGVSADVNVIRQTVEDCFERQFSKKIFLSEIEIGRKLEIKVSAASLDKELFAEVEKQLGRLLRDRFGYTKPFHLIVKL